MRVSRSTVESLIINLVMVKEEDKGRGYVAVHGMDVFFVYGFKNYSGNATVIKGRTPKGKRKKSRV
jgi:hypothetical protein